MSQAPELSAGSTFGSAWVPPRSMILAAAALAAAAGTAALGQQPPRETIRVRSALVTVPVVVTDRDGRYVPDLRVDDFTLLQDGVRQPVHLFSGGQEPLQVALLLDTSRSTAGVLDEIRTAALEFLQNLEARDRAMVVRFDSSVAVLAALESGRAAAEGAIRGVVPAAEPGTRLRDAVAEVLGLFRQIESRKAIVLLSDGSDQGSAIAPEGLFGTAAEGGTPVYAVYYGRTAERRRRGGLLRRERPPPGPPVPTVVWERARRYLEELADLTAGRLYESGVPDLRVSFGRIARELRQQYVLGFYPDRKQLDGRFHGLAVRVARPGAVVRSRRAYHAR